jgi:hypothetical protein
MISIPFYQVLNPIDPDRVYACGQQPDPETAITHFNSKYGPTVGKTLTMMPTETPCVDYVLIELERKAGALALAWITSGLYHFLRPRLKNCLRPPWES